MKPQGKHQPPTREQRVQHLMTRARERYGWYMAESDIAALTAHIRKRDPKEVKLVARQRRGEVLLVQWWNRWILVALVGRQPVTFLPLEAQFLEDGTPIMPDTPPRA